MTSIRNALGPSRSTRSSLRSYHRVTRTATFSFISTVPLLLAYEVLVRIANWGELGQIRVGADVWLHQLFALFGLTGTTALSVGILATGVAIVYWERKKHIPLRPSYFGAILAESTIFAIVLTGVVSMVVGAIFMMAPQAHVLAATFEQHGLLMQIALSLGAGFYEELFFRVLLVGGLYVALNYLLNDQTRSYVWAAFIGALLFSAVHYIGPFGDVFTVSSFTYRLLFGLALNGLFLWRGFAVAAWTHAIYDVLLVIGFL